MKKLKYIYSWSVCLLTLLVFAGCEKTDYPTFATDFTGIYFPEDSIRYSFGITPLTTTTYTIEIPVKIMGAPVSQKRTYVIETVTAKTTATPNVHYNMPAECVIEADSINGILPLQVIRKDLGDTESFQVTFKLVTNDQFSPISEAGDQVIAIFNNIVEPPAWKDWQGNITWPQSYLGPWNPVVWIKFMEYFRQMEQTVPATYTAMVAKYGPNLENVQYGWPSDYSYSVKKYILIPMYKFFQEHPEYEVEMPDPNS